MRLLPVLLTVLACSSAAASAQDRARAGDATPLAVSASAHDPASSPATAAPTPAPAAGSNASDVATPARKTRVTWEQHFAQANTTHDGHLTLEQAKAGYASIVRHFADIDVAKKGFVTEDDIRAWHKTQRAARHGQSGNQPAG